RLPRLARPPRSALAHARPRADSPRARPGLRPRQPQARRRRVRLVGAAFDAPGRGPPRSAPRTRGAQRRRGARVSRLTWGFLYWGLGWIALGFLVPELLGYFGIAPWPTFSQTVWSAEGYRFVGPVVFATLLALMAHFLYHRPLWASML